ncbi:MAG: DUF72 domain-containing protein [Planctomycetes bacterium]|nr:DUF72 domain-containing protein [Planctomycetota bacterium]
MALLLGVAGWSYPDWRGTVYPRGCRDPLRYCAELVDLIEINSTFYRFPDPAICAAWVQRVADLPVEWSAKLPREFTHRACVDPGAAASACEGFAPLSAGGRLRTLLAQFSYHFEHHPDSVAHLHWLRDAFADVAPLTVEVRHRSWTHPTARADLEAAGVAVANLDYAGARSGFDVHATHQNGRHRTAYLRLHGRNPAWFDARAGRDEVYDYTYTAAEVDEIAVRAAAIDAQAATTVVVANNHFRGQAMKLVLELAARCRGAPVRVPAPLLATYPALRAIAADPGAGARQGELF